MGLPFSLLRGALQSRAPAAPALTRAQPQPAQLPAPSRCPVAPGTAKASPRRGARYDRARPAARRARTTPGARHGLRAPLRRSGSGGWGVRVGADLAGESAALAARGEHEEQRQHRESASRRVRGCGCGCQVGRGCRGPPFQCKPSDVLSSHRTIPLLEPSHSRG